MPWKCRYGPFCLTSLIEAESVFMGVLANVCVYCVWECRLKKKPAEEMATKHFHGLFHSVFQKYQPCCSQSRKF